MGYQYWNYNQLKQLCLDAFEAFGFSKDEASIITDVLLTSDLGIAGTVVGGERVYAGMA